MTTKSTLRRAPAPSSWETQFSSAIVGDIPFAEKFGPALRRYNWGLIDPSGAPLLSALLLGPSGVGKTQSVYEFAAAIHGAPAGDRSHVLRIDCGEYQREHEVAKLIGAPPGYLGHRETQPLLSQVKVNLVMSDRLNLSVVLFDEIEKAAESLQRLLLGVLDRGVLTLGDNSKVNLSRCVIFFTSNLGQKEIAALAKGATYGLTSAPPTDTHKAKALRGSVNRHFSAEFLNRVTHILHYKSPTSAEWGQIIRLFVSAAEKTAEASASPQLRPYFPDVTSGYYTTLVDALQTAGISPRQLRREVLAQTFDAMILAAESLRPAPAKFGKKQAVELLEKLQKVDFFDTLKVNQ